MLREIVLGNHKFLHGALALDVGCAIYDPLDPDNSVIADIHPSEAPWNHALVKLYGGEVVEKVLIDVPWGCGDLNAYPEEGILLVSYATTNIVEFRKLDTLDLVKRVRVEGVSRVYSAALDSQGRLWVVGDGGLYTVEEYGAKLVKGFGYAVSMDCQRAAPSRTIAVVDHLAHVVELISEEGDCKGRIYFPYPGGARFTPDERLIVSSGRLPNHVQLTMIVGATHLTNQSPWFGYLWDFGTLASNRADSYHLDRVLIQWSLSLFEVPVPLPKHKPYVVRMGRGCNGGYVVEKGYTAPTPLPVLGLCHLVIEGRGRIAIEMLRPRYALLAPQMSEEWIAVDAIEVSGISSYRIEVPGIYRVKVLKGEVVDCYAVCKPIATP